MVYRRPGSKNYVMDFSVTWMSKTHRVNKSTRESDKARALQAEAQEREQLMNRLKGRVTGDDMTLSQAADRMWRDEWIDRADGPNQYARVKRLIDIHGDVSLSGVDEVWIAKIRDDLRKHAKSKATVNRYLCHVRAILSRATGYWGVKMQVPRFPMYKETAGRLRIISREEEARIIGLLQSSPAHAEAGYADLVAVLLDTGMRLSESLKLDYKHNIDLHQSVIHLYADQTKTKKARSVPMTDRVHRILHARSVSGTQPFPWSKSRVEKMWQWVRRQTGITDKEFVIHSLRHTFASRLVQQDASLLGVKDLMGHSCLQTTNRYAHLSMGNHRGMINMLNPRADDHTKTVGETVGAEA